MTKPFKEWKVLPHGPLDEIDEGILTVTGQLQMPLAEIPRRMTVVRLADRRLVVFSAIALADDAMATIERYGVPAFLVVPNDHHRLDARIWKDRYPALQVVAPAGAQEKVGEAVPVDTVAPDFGDRDVEFVAVPGTQGHEAALVVRRPGGTTLVVNDLVANIRHEHGFGGWLLRVLGFAGDAAQIPKPARMTLIEDTEALRAQLLRWADIAELRRILVSHGETIEDDPRGTLRALAESLK